MTRKTSNPEKGEIGSLQRIYSFYFKAAFCACLCLLLLVIAALISLFQARIEYGLLIALAITVLFFPAYIFFEVSNKTHKLKFPAFISEKMLKIIRNLAIIIFFLVFAYGIIVYFYGPITSDGNLYTDKLGRVYSFNDFLIFEKWQFTYIITFCIAALQGIVFLPISDRHSRKLLL